MTVLRYRPASSGGWLIVADGRRALIVGPSGWDLADDAATVIGGDRGFETTIDVLTRAGFASIPDFVLLEWTGDSVHSLLRGPVTLSVTDGVGEHTQDGAGISTWTERSFTGATAVHATIDGASAASDVDALTLRSGVAFLESCALDFSDAGEPSHPASGREPAVSPAPEPAPGAGQATASAEVSEATVSSVQEEPAGPPIDTIVTTATPVAGVDGLEIDGPVADAPGSEASGIEAADADGPDDATIMRPSSAVPPPPAGASAEPPASDRAGDHDGNTILSSDIAKLRTGRGPKASARSTAAEESTLQERSPSMFLDLPDGSREQLDQPLLIGRSPSVSQVSGDRMPRLITIGGGDQDISRNHARFAVEGGTVVVTDLHSRNGTLVVLPGKSPQKLRAGEPTSVIVGTVVDLGGGITLTVGVQ